MQPVSVENNVSFVVNLSCLSNPDDVRADDLGAWKCNGSRSLQFSVILSDKVCRINRSKSKSKIVIYVRRQYHVHGTDPDFHHMIAFVEGREGKFHLTFCTSSNTCH